MFKGIRVKRCSTKCAGLFPETWTSFHRLFTTRLIDVTNVQNAFMMMVRMAIRAPIMLIGAAVMAVSINPSLSLVFIIALPVLGVCIYLIMSNAHPGSGAMLKNTTASTPGCRKT